MLLGENLAYLFVFDLTPTADSRHGIKARGAGPRTFSGVPEGFTTARWMDNDEELEVERKGDSATVKATRYPYGTNTVVRVARMSRA